MSKRSVIVAFLTLIFVLALVLGKTRLIDRPAEKAAPGPIISEILPIPVDKRPQQIDHYFKRKNMPLEGYGYRFVMAADIFDIDWTELAAISVRESSGGRNACGNNPFGWGSCSLDFESIDKGIIEVTKNLAGKNPATAAYYSGPPEKDLASYNPPSIAPHYVEEVLAIMNDIRNEPVE